MDLIKSSDTEYEEYEALLLERDQLNKEAGQIWTAYIKEFGQLIYDAYEEQVACVKDKKIIAFCQAALNRGEDIDEDALEKHLDAEMAAYREELKRMLAEKDQCQKSEESSVYEVLRAKELYRRLAKLIHPDLNPRTDTSKILQELWQRIVTAYHHNDVRELAELEVLTRKALKDLGQGDIRVEIPDIGEKIMELEEETDRIKHTKPYIYKDLLDDDGAKEKKRAELEEELVSYRRYHKELDDVIRDMLNNGADKPQWLMS